MAADTTTTSTDPATRAHELVKIGPWSWSALLARVVRETGCDQLKALHAVSLHVKRGHFRYESGYVSLA